MLFLLLVSFPGTYEFIWQVFFFTWDEGAVRFES